MVEDISGVKRPDKDVVALEAMSPDGSTRRLIAREISPEQAWKYGDDKLIAPSWWEGYRYQLLAPMPPGAGVGLVTTPYQTWYDRTWGVVPIADLPKYRDYYRKVPVIKAAIDRTTMLCLARGFELKLDKKAPFHDEFLDGLSKWIAKLPFTWIMNQIFHDMQVYGNAFVEVVYEKLDKKMLPEGKVEDYEEAPSEWKAGITPDEPKGFQTGEGRGMVVNLKTLDPLYMRVRRDAYGNIYGYVQWLLHPPVAFDTDHMVHISFNTKSWAYESAYGTSILMSLIKTQEMIWQMESDFMAVSHINISPSLAIFGGTQERPYSDQQLSALRTATLNRGPASTIYLKGDCTATKLDLLANINGIVRYFDYLCEQRIILLGVPPDVLGQNMGGGSYAKAAVNVQEFKARIRSLQERVSDALHDQIFPKVLAAMFPDIDIDKVEIPTVKWNSVFEEDTTQIYQKTMAVYQIGLITKRQALQELGYEIQDPDDPSLDEFYKAPTMGMVGGFPSIGMGDRLNSPDKKPDDNIDPKEEGDDEKKVTIPGKGPPITGEPASRDRKPGEPGLPRKQANALHLDDRIYRASMGEMNGFSVYVVNWAVVREMLDERWGTKKGEMIGGHHWALAMKYIPQNEVWVSDHVEPNERKFVALHESTEAPLMRDGVSYRVAHAQANEVETIYRKSESWIGEDTSPFGTTGEASLETPPAPPEPPSPPLPPAPNILKAEGEYIEEEHPRDETGEWTFKEGGGSSSGKPDAKFRKEKTPSDAPKKPEGVAKPDAHPQRTTGGVSPKEKARILGKRATKLLKAELGPKVIDTEEQWDEVKKTYAGAEKKFGTHWHPMRFSNDVIDHENKTVYECKGYSKFQKDIKIKSGNLIDRKRKLFSAKYLGYKLKTRLYVLNGEPEIYEMDGFRGTRWYNLKPKNDAAVHRFKISGRPIPR